MYLKKIEIQGFKSFANKIIFDLHKGITGIVGPNGSGKSNVSDAIRWVLGEQSAKNLRGVNMQDVIFAGTTLRKAQGYAYVAISFDNSDKFLDIDFEEVIISRRLFRSGESEYMINGSVVRLKDINELFYDTGIGKDGYSIIGQGQVEKILSARTDERRELFDEAVGITKFKRRKNTAIKKLENEKANLTRVLDILTELEKQLAPMENQAKKAKEYLKLRDKLKVLDANMFILQEENLEKELNQLNISEDILNKDLHSLSLESQNINNDFDEIGKDIELAEVSIEKIKENINKSNMDLKDLYGQINVIKEQINTDTINLEHQNSRKNIIKNDIENKKSNLKLEEKNINDFLIDLKDKESIKIDIDENIKNLNFEIDKTQNSIAEYNKIKIENLNYSSDLKIELESLKTNISQLNIRKSEVNARYFNINLEKEELENKIELENDNLKIITKDKNELLQKQADLKQKQEILEKEIHIIKENLSKSNISNRKYQVDYDSLKNLYERYEGFGISIKKIMEKRNDFKGIYGLVADLIKMDKKYELAIEVALGAKIQNIVVDNENVAKTLIEYLKENKFGRATFLPLNSVSKVSVLKNSQVLKEKGVISLASELVSCEEIYRILVDNLLSKIIIVDNIDNAIEISKKYKYEYRIVTLSGEQFLPGGSISGGAYKNSSNLLSRKRELSELAQNIKDSKIEISNFENNLNSVNNDYENNQILLDEINQKILTKSTDIQISNNNLEAFLERKDRLSKDFLAIKEEFENLNIEIEKNKTSYEKLNQEISSFDINKISREDDIEILQEKLDDLKHNLSIYLDKQKEFDLNLFSLNSKIEYSKNNSLKLNEEILVLEKEESELYKYSDYEEKIKEKNNLIRKLGVNIEELKLLIENYEKDLQSNISKKEDKAKKYKLIFSKKEDIMQRIALIEKDIFRVQSKKEKFQENIANISNYIWNEYELSLKDCLEFKNPEYSKLPELRKKIDEQKLLIKKLGNINIDSIEEYNNISSRYTDLKIQYDDIMLATSGLNQIILDLDQGMKEQFKQNFALINMEFNKVFNELFAGGNACLKLDENADILESDINIIAQPPGKKLQNMMQLSGGEKALTAISLLFAIQNLAPSPFVILDEIEAALDDSNVDRFAKYLHLLNKKTQFIVITHRRGTMLNVDSLYGITMKEKGVSTLVSVSLIEDELDN